jgi:hypothetical protein
MLASAFGFASLQPGVVVGFTGNGTLVAHPPARGKGSQNGEGECNEKGRDQDFLDFHGSKSSIL